MAASRYDKLIERVFLLAHRKGATVAEFKRELLIECAHSLRIELPKNIGDVVYTFRYRRPLPHSIVSKAPKGTVWVIRPAGDGIYRFVAIKPVNLTPTARLVKVKVPDATPGIISAYALEDEQALLAKLRYNRLVDIFTRVTCHSLQNHLRTKVPGLGQIEVDEMYLGIDRHGSHYVIPIQAKTGRGQLNVVQIEQDMSLCAHKFPSLICRAIGAQFLSKDTIAMLELGMQEGEVVVVAEAHYKLVPHEEISAEDLAKYRERSAEELS